MDEPDVPRTEDDDEAWWARAAPDPYATPRGGQPAYGGAAFGQGGAGGSGAEPGWGPPVGVPAYSADSAVRTGWGGGAATAPDAGARPPYGEPAPDAWGTPVRPGRSAGGRGLAVVGALLAAGLVGGVAGGAVVAARDGRDLTDPTASLGTGAAAGSVQRPPDSVAGIADRVLRSTVSISVSRGTSGGSGSGVVLRSDGYVLTNNHVVADGAQGGTITVTVNGSEGRELPAQVVGLDPETDLAVIKVDRRRPPHAGRPRPLARPGRRRPRHRHRQPARAQRHRDDGHRRRRSTAPSPCRARTAGARRRCSTPSRPTPPSTPATPGARSSTAAGASSASTPPSRPSAAPRASRAAASASASRSPSTRPGRWPRRSSVPVARPTRRRRGGGQRGRRRRHAGRRPDQPGRRRRSRRGRRAAGRRRHRPGRRTDVGSVDELILALRQSRVGDRVRVDLPARRPASAPPRSCSPTSPATSA